MKIVRRNVYTVAHSMMLRLIGWEHYNSILNEKEIRDTQFEYAIIYRLYVNLRIQYHTENIIEFETKQSIQLSIAEHDMLRNALYCRVARSPQNKSASVP